MQLDNSSARIRTTHTHTYILRYNSCVPFQFPLHVRVWTGAELCDVVQAGMSATEDGTLSPDGRLTAWKTSDKPFSQLLQCALKRTLTTQAKRFALEITRLSFSPASRTTYSFPDVNYLGSGKSLDFLIALRTVRNCSKFMCQLQHPSTANMTSIWQTPSNISSLKAPVRVRTGWIILSE